MRDLLRIALALAVIGAATARDAAAARPLDGYLREGDVAGALKAYEHPRNDAERFSLATAQVLDGLQEFSAGLGSLGLRHDSPLSFLPFFRVAMPAAGRAPGEPLGVATPAAIGHHFRALRASLQAAAETLSHLEGEEFGVTVDLSRIRLDFDGDGQVAEHELLLASLSDLMGGVWAPSPEAPDLVIRFDAADALWLRGYAHGLCGVLDILLGYQWRPVWDQCAHQLFVAPDPYPPLQQWVERGVGFEEWVDLIAAVHEMRLPLVDDRAWPHARDEFAAMFADSRACWRKVLAETDDDREWLPSPTQAGPRDSRISQAEIDGWLAVLDELDAILRGEKLLPHPRLRPGAGIDVDRFVASPPPLDLVMWLQGSALLPYLRTGPVSDGERWDALTRPFGPGFLRFAIWSN